MAQHTKTQSETGYGLPQPTFIPVKAPIVSKRDPATSDIGYSIGQQWINTTSHSFWALAANAAGSASWVTLGNLTSTYTSLSTGSLAVTAGSAAVTGGNITVSGGNLEVLSAGKGLQIKEGSNARMGQSTLVAGTVTVANTSVTANTRIFLSRASAGGTPGALGTLCPGTVTPSTSFVINSVSPTDGTTVVTTDVSVVNWLLIEKL